MVQVLLGEGLDHFGEISSFQKRLEEARTVNPLHPPVPHPPTVDQKHLEKKFYSVSKIKT